MPIGIAPGNIDGIQLLLACPNLRPYSQVFSNRQTHPSFSSTSDTSGTYSSKFRERQASTQPQLSTYLQPAEQWLQA